MTNIKEKITNIFEEEEKMASTLEEENKWTKTDTEITITVALVFSMFAFIFIPNPLMERFELMTITPSQSLYLPYNLLPIQTNGIINNRPAIFSFNGVPLANGTECVSYVQIYPFNYTSQNFNSQPLTINNPVELAKIYYKIDTEYYIYGFNGQIQIPSNSTLLCPSIVKDIK